jgi:hypothetical protein
MAGKAKPEAANVQLELLLSADSGHPTEFD